MRLLVLLSLAAVGMAALGADVDDTTLPNGCLPCGAGGRSYCEITRGLLLGAEDTLIFAAGRKALFWRQVRCEPAPMLALRTTRVIGIAGLDVKQPFALVNIGGGDATDIRLALAGGTAKLDRLAAGQEATVEMKIALPPIDPNRNAMPELSWQIGEPAGNLRPIRPEKGDGQVVSVSRGKRMALMPDQDKSSPDRPVKYIYFAIDKAECPPGDYDCIAEVEYFGRGGGSFTIEYDSTNGGDPYKETRSIAITKTSAWRKASIPLPACRFSGRQNNGADFRISGVVAIRGISIKPIPTAAVQTTQTEMLLRYSSFGHEVVQSLPVTLLSVPPVRKRAIRAVVYVVNPYDFGERRLGTGPKAMPVEVSEKDIDSKRWRRVYVCDETGRGIPCRRRLGKVLFSAPLSGPAAMFTLSATPIKPLDADIRLVDFSAGENGFVLVENEYLSLLFDETRGGTLVSIVDRKADVDYAAYPAGACVVQYETPRGGRILSSQWDGRIRVTEQRPNRISLVCRTSNRDMTIKDTWRIRSHDPAAHLKREITLTRDVPAADFMPLNLRLDAGPFDMTFPCGVGFARGGAKFGTLDTWHIADAYFAFGGSHLYSSRAAGITILDRSSVKRVHYGFFGDELQVRFRGQSPLAYGEDITIEAELFAGPGLHYEYGHERALLHETPPMVWVPASGQTLPAEQARRPEAPLYMRDVRKPYW